MFINLKIGGGIKERTESTIRYYNDIKDFPLLSKEEESRLLYIVHNGSEEESIKARNKLIKCNQRFVVASAKRQMCPGIELVDLVSEANIGLMEAIEKFDASKNSKLLSYAAYYIKRNIDQFKVNYGKVVRKKNGEKLYHFTAKTSSMLLQKFEREPTSEEISQALKSAYNISIKYSNDINDIRLTRIDNATENNENNELLLSEINEFNRLTYNSNYYMNDVKQDDNLYKTSILMKCLDEREKEIIRYLYGIKEDFPIQDKSVNKYSTLAKKFGVTKERVRQIHKEALQKMKMFAEEYTKT